MMHTILNDLNSNGEVFQKGEVWKKKGEKQASQTGQQKHTEKRRGAVKCRVFAQKHALRGKGNTKMFGCMQFQTLFWMLGACFSAQFVHLSSAFLCEKQNCNSLKPHSLSLPYIAFTLYLCVCVMAS